MVFHDGTLRKQPKKGCQDRLAMTQKRKTQEMQESQTLAPGSREPMTGAQASYLKMLAEEVQEPSAFEQGLSQREASRRIDALMERLRLGDLPPHTD
jgi:Protein of unknown function (DUF3072)